MLSIAAAPALAWSELPLTGPAVERALLLPRKPPEKGGGSANAELHRLATPYAGDEFFVHFRLRYDLESVTSPDGGKGEFFALWL